MGLSNDRRGNFFEDFRLGMKIRHATPRTLTDGDRSLYIGLTGSRSALYTAHSNAELLGCGNWPLEDLLVFNTAFGKTVPDISLNAAANLGYAEVRFIAPVYPGDTLAVESEIIGLKENSSRKTGVVYVRSTARNQRQQEILQWVRWVMVHKRDPQATCPESLVPSTQAAIGAAQLRQHGYTPQALRITEATGAEELWEDYDEGQRIDHPGAMTVNDSDHSIATRLYQNTARAHFDGYGMAAQDGQRLVYGGHVMSLCRALSYDGLENSLSILAINGGSHVNPTYAGDTIACATTVLQRIDLGQAHMGALRLRTIGIKNAAVASISFPDPGAGRPSHPAQVVLDIDYTIAMPRRSA